MWLVFCLFFFSCADWSFDDPFPGSRENLGGVVICLMGGAAFSRLGQGSKVRRREI